MLRQQKKYKDTWVKICGSLFCSHFIEAMGRTESIFQLILTKNYLLALSSGFVIAFIIWEFISRMTAWLDDRYDWLAHTLQRFLLQLLLSFLVPAVLLYLLTLLQMQVLFRQNINRTEYLLYEFPAACLLLVLVNAYYLVYYFYQRAAASPPIAPAAPAAPEIKTEEPAETVEEPKKSPVLLVNKGAQTLPLPTKEIAYAYKNNDYGFIKTFDGETFFNAFTLDELESKLDEQLFFRANRQLIVHWKACRSFTPATHGKLELHLQPETKEPVIISQKKAPAFREWLQQHK